MSLPIDAVGRRDHPVNVDERAAAVVDSRKLGRQHRLLEATEKPNIVPMFNQNPGDSDSKPRETQRISNRAELVRSEVVPCNTLGIMNMNNLVTSERQIAIRPKHCALAQQVQIMGTDRTYALP